MRKKTSRSVRSSEQNEKTSNSPTKPKPVRKSTGGRSNFHIEFKNKAQGLAWATFKQHDVMFMTGPAGTGKTFLACAFAIEQVLKKEKKKIVITRPIVEAGESLGYLPGPQPLDAKVLTPNGWVYMGDLKVGDFAIGRDGHPTKILKIFPKGKKDVYKLTTTEDASTECCLDHLWLTQTRKEMKNNQSGSVKTTKEVIQTFSHKGKTNHFIPRNEAVHFEHNDLPLSSYVLGVLLTGNSIGNTTIFNKNEREIIDRVTEEVKDIGCSLSRMNKSLLYKNTKGLHEIRKVLSNSVCSASYGENKAVGFATNKNSGHLTTYGKKYKFVSTGKTCFNPVKVVLKELGLFRKNCSELFIPQIYKFSSVKDRFDLLHGLMDKGGKLKKNGKSLFITASKQMAKDVVELVQSLGGKAVLKEKDKFETNRLSHKHSNCVDYRTFEVLISLNQNPFFMKSKSERYSPFPIRPAGIKSIEKLSEKEVQCILVDNSEHLYITDQYIVTHNTFDEKVHPYMLPMYDCIDRLVGKDIETKERILELIEVAPIAYMRGRTFHDSICIFDEAQNANMTQIKLFLTRFAEDSKVILTGDPKQSDIGTASALGPAMRKLKGVAGIGFVEFKEPHIVRHPLIGNIIKALEE